MVNHLTLRRLDRIHRFVRLWRPWAIEELDYVLTRLTTQGLANGIDDNALNKILDLLDLNAKWSLPIDELMALSDVFPEKGLREPTSLFDRLFNQPPFFSRDGCWPPDPVIRFVHPAWASSPQGVSNPNNNTLSRLLAGLQIGDKELVELIASLTAIPAIGHPSATFTPTTPVPATPPPGIPPIGPLHPLARATHESIVLSKESIGILYRHARLMRLLKSMVTDFIKLIKLTPRIAARSAAERYIRDLEDVTSVIEFATWQKSSGFSLDEIIYVTGGHRPEESPDPEKVSSEIVARVKAEKSLEFADTVFTQIGRITDLQSRKIVLDNVGPTKAFEILPDGVSYRLNAGFILDPAPRLLDLSIDLPADELNKYNALAADLLKKYDAMHVFDVALGSALNLSPEETKELRKLAADPVGIADVHFIPLSLQSGDKTRLTALLTDTLRYGALFKSKVSNVNGLSFAANNRAVFFGPQSDPANWYITTQVVRNVAAYVALATPTDAGFTTASGPADIDALQTVVKGVGTASEANLAKTLRTDKTRIGALKPHLIPLPNNPFDALGVLARCLAFTEQMGVSGETLSLMIKEDNDTFIALSRAAEDVFGAFRAKYPKEKIFQEKMEPFEDKLRTRKRDGLVDFIVSKWPEPFADPNKLYEYFLIDVLLEGCARTSRVVAAISSLQLYVHRVLMNLERSNDWYGSVPAKGSVYAHFTDPDKRAEWYWREHYRIWEANRKVFLYPENYIEPELRDDKTPLFKELEDTLLQQEISDSNVHDAYAKYLTGFDEVARLKIAGAYYDASADALHLFGVTQDAPPVYYYRVIEKTLSAVPRISAWQKLSLQIPVRKVSPIVFEERLYVFWLETTTRPLNSFDEGTSKFGGYRHAVRIKYSTLRADGAWTPPQSLGFSNGVAIEESRIINDLLLTDAAKRKTLETQISDLEKQIRALVEAEGIASEEVRRTNGVVVFREGEMTAASSQSDDVEAVATVMAASSAALSAALLVTFGGPPAQAAAWALAWWGVLAAVVQKPVSVLVRAGVNMLDAPHVARRKYALWLAKFIAGLAANTLILVTDALMTVRTRLANTEKVNFSVRWDKSGRDHSEPLDNYKPEGWEWDRVYPDVGSPPNSLEPKSIRLMLVPRDEPVPSTGKFQFLTSNKVDLTSSILGQLPPTDQHYVDTRKRISNFYGNFFRVNSYSTTDGVQEFYLASFWLNEPSKAGNPVALAPVNSDVQVVNGDTTSASVIIESKGSSVWVREDFWAEVFRGKRLGTTLTATLLTRFNHKGASSLLEAGFQETLTEFPLKISPVAGQFDIEMQNPFHPTNPFLTYFRETFFHIPFLVANHLNSQQKFAETQRWYHYIFNPTAADGNPWRYREFNDPMNSQSLRDMLTDPDALTTYRADPFNPHAIARTRLSAYQKSVVMKYIDNLLDWGDSLFNQFTMESVNEATMLYVMAQDILGPRPPVLGSCGEGKVVPKNYNMART
ncbi:MAG: neuraminidase-like domain-containing protein [Pyrinomonadaceae bacterium]